MEVCSACDKIITGEMMTIEVKRGNYKHQYYHPTAVDCANQQVTRELTRHGQRRQQARAQASKAHH